VYMQFSQNTLAAVNAHHPQQSQRLQN